MSVSADAAPSPAPSLDRALAALDRRRSGPNVQLEMRRDDTLRPVIADPAQIEQVLLNLIINARDALPEGGHITVRTAWSGIVTGLCLRAYTTGRPR